MSMNTRTNRRAAMILLPTACVLLVLSLFHGPDSGRVLASAMQRFREAETITCNVTIRMNVKMSSPDGTPFQTQTIDTTEKLYISAADGVRRDAYENGELVRTTFDPGERKVVVLDYRNERYTDFGAVPQTEEARRLEDTLRDMAAERGLPELQFFDLSHDPDRLIRSLRRLAVDADRELGRAEIEGYEAIGFELSGKKIGFAPPVAEASPDNRAELWVDIEEELPLRLVMHFATQVAQMKDLPMSASFEMTATYDHFEFDVPLDPHWFEPQIPEWFEPAEEIDVPLATAPTEEAFIEALDVFAEYAGRYPGTLQPTNLTFEISYLMGTLQAKHLAAKQRGQTAEGLPEPSEIGAKLQGLIYFLILDASGREPHYFGKTVQPGDAEAILVQWTLEDGSTRIIYGDLQTATLP